MEKSTGSREEKDYMRLFKHSRKCFTKSVLRQFMRVKVRVSNG